MKALLSSILLLFLCEFVGAAPKPQTRNAPPQHFQTQSQPQTQTQTRASHEKISPVLEAQIWLDRRNYSPGLIDGNLGKNLQMTLETYRQDNNLPSSSRIDDQTLNSLRQPDVDPITTYTVTEQDVKGPYIDNVPKGYMEQSKLDSLGYLSELEALGERFHCSPALLKKMNRKSDFSAGSEIRVPNVANEQEQQPGTTAQTQEAKNVQQVSGKVAQKGAASNSVVVTKEKSQLVVQDPDGKTIFLAPITTGSDDEPYPFGSWKVKGISWNPHFEYDPSLFKDAPPTDTKAKLPPGPNSPVGVVWIDLTAPHYGIHGTPDPGRIGYTQSHGCIRLTNWDAVKVANLVKFGTSVTFQ